MTEGVKESISVLLDKCPPWLRGTLGGWFPGTYDHALASSLSRRGVETEFFHNFPANGGEGGRRPGEGASTGRRQSDTKVQIAAAVGEMRFRVRLLLLNCFLFLTSTLVCYGTNAQEAPFDWRSDWAVEEGFSVGIDTEGYDFPSAIAFVPNPGMGPKDPLYFVTELRGKVKVVTNDRTVYTFAENFFQFTPKEELPADQGAAGLAGICLDPKHGYVFVTFVYQDPDKVLRNNIIRFQSKPETFSLKPATQFDFKEVFLPYESGILHNIGPCQVCDNSLYVGLGEAWQTVKTQQVDVLVGKVIRMNLDGSPLPDNPFHQDSDVSKAANYVWAYGFRNPYSLKVIEDRVFVADNGHDIDRFLEVRKGENYLWDGNDKSIASNAGYVFVPARAPVQMDYCPRGQSVFPAKYEQHFFLALSAMKRSKGKIPGIMTIQYGLKENRVLSVPRDFVRYRGKKFQIVAGLAFGPDGLYFSPLFPDREGKTPILKVTYNPDEKYPFTLLERNNDDTAFSLMLEKGCLGCHELGDKGGGSVGPPLDRESLIARLDKKLNSQMYVQSTREMDRLDQEPQRSYREARNEVFAAQGLERVRIWMKHQIREPRFDQRYSLMPNLGVSQKEALIITDYLLGKEEEPNRLALLGLLPAKFRIRHLLLSFAAGFLLACSLWPLRQRFKRNWPAANPRSVLDDLSFSNDKSTP